MTREAPIKSTADRRWLLVGSSAAALGLAGRLVFDAFSPAGIAHTLGRGDGAGLLWADGSTALTWVLLIETCALAGVVGNYATGKQKTSMVGNLAAGHVRFAAWVGVGLWTLAVGIFGALCWLGAAAVRSWQGSNQQETDPADDFAAFDTGDSGTLQQRDHGGSPNLAAS